jgi:hypothetical protein
LSSRNLSAREIQNDGRRSAGWFKELPQILLNGNQVGLTDGVLAHLIKREILVLAAQELVPQ